MFFVFLKFLAIILCLNSVNGSTLIAAKNDKVEVTLLYDSLCELCQDFIPRLNKSYSEIGDYMRLEMVPYGNVKDVEVNGTKTKSCEHGPDECYGNKVHGCTLEHNSISDSLGFISCTVASSSPVKNSTFEKCAESHNISWTRIESCLNSGEAETIFEKYGERTTSLRPIFIPYIMVDEEYSEIIEIAAFENLTLYICATLNQRGSTLPTICSSFSTNPTP